jgi:hypothetical protein
MRRIPDISRPLSQRSERIYAQLFPSRDPQEEERRRIDLLGRLARLTRAQLLEILEDLKSRGIISSYNEGSPDNVLAEIIADRLDYLAPHYRALVLNGAPKVPVDRKILNRLTEKIISDYSPAEIDSFLARLADYGILQMPYGTPIDKAGILARVTLEDLPLVKARIPALELLVREVNSGAKVNNTSLLQAIEYVVSQPNREIREALRQLSGPSLPYRPGRSKDTAARVLLARLAAYPQRRVEGLLPLSKRAYKILKGKETYASPSRLGTRTRYPLIRPNFTPPKPFIATDAGRD